MGFADGIWTNETKLSKDYQFNILDKIEFDDDLINMAMMNNNYLMLATDIFNKKFEKSVVKIHEHLSHQHIQFDCGR